jgi:hypothetical protein
MFQLHFPIMKIAHLQIYMISGFATYQRRWSAKHYFRFLLYHVFGYFAVAGYSSKKNARQTRDGGHRTVFGFFKRQRCYRGAAGDSVLHMLMKSITD